jgi:hypothetical protein
MTMGRNHVESDVEEEEMGPPVPYSGCEAFQTATMGIVRGPAPGRVGTEERVLNVAVGARRRLQDLSRCTPTSGSGPPTDAELNSTTNVGLFGPTLPFAPKASAISSMRASNLSCW